MLAWGYFLQVLQRFYHNVDLWGIKLYHHTNFHIYWSFCWWDTVMLAWGYLLLYYKIYIVYRDLITMLIIGVLDFIIIPIFTFSGTFVSEIQKCLPEAICCCITRFTLFTEILSQCWSLVYCTLPSHQFPHLVELLLVRYGNTCLRLFFTRFTWFTEILSQCWSLRY